MAILGLTAAHAQSAGRLEMDVMEVDESPGQALKRMEDAARRANADPTGRGDRPDLGPYIPDDSLGTRGLLVPEPTGIGLREEGFGFDPPNPDDVIDRYGGREHEGRDDDDRKGKKDDEDDGGGGKGGKGGKG